MKDDDFISNIIQQYIKQLSIARGGHQTTMVRHVPISDAKQLLNPTPNCSPDIDKCCLCIKRPATHMVVHTFHVNPYMFVCKLCFEKIV
tara:strand:+ start:14520 stop:14786 length:267 start_codon:yes stop_codon:yes gene_type:complete